LAFLGVLGAAIGIVIRSDKRIGIGLAVACCVTTPLGVHRRMVREAVRNAVPAQRKKTERPAVKMAAAATLIDAILESDRKAPRKQRHTARRIFDRIRAEVLLPLRPSGYAPAEPNTRNINVPQGGPKQTAEVGQAKLPNSSSPHKRRCRQGQLSIDAKSPLRELYG
jgi:hypothetical protein